MRVMKGRKVTRRQLQVGALATLVVLLVGGQLLLPWIGARVVRSKLGDPSAEVTVKAFPAWKMVFGKVDSVDVRSAGLERSDDELSDLLERSKDVGRITSVVGRMTIGGLELRDVRTRIEDGRVADLPPVQQRRPFIARLRAEGVADGGADQIDGFHAASFVVSSTISPSRMTMRRSHRAARSSSIAVPTRDERRGGPSGGPGSRFAARPRSRGACGRCPPGATACGCASFRVASGPGR